MRGLVMLLLLVRTVFLFLCSLHVTFCCPILTSSFIYSSDDGKLKAESDSGEFWVLFGGFAPIGKKIVTEDDIIAEKTAPQLYRWMFINILSDSLAIGTSTHIFM